MYIILILVKTSSCAHFDAAGVGYNTLKSRNKQHRENEGRENVNKKIQV